MSGTTQSALVEQLIANQGGGTDPASFFAQHPNPTVRLLGEMWARRAQEEDGQPEAAPPMPTAPVSTETDEPAAREQRLRRRLKALRRELETQRAVSETLAAALGACPRCWGADPGCAICRGDGVPGGAVPDRALFRQYVLPAALRLRPRKRPNPEPPTRDTKGAIP